jgi:hypothetical protein
VKSPRTPRTTEIVPLIAVATLATSATLQKLETPTRPPDADKSAFAAKDQVTVPLKVEGNRPLVDLTFQRADGTSRTATFLVDSGGGGFLMIEPLAKDLGVEWGESRREEGEEFALAKSVPKVSVGEFPLELNPERVLVELKQDNTLPKSAPGHADGMLPGHVLAKYHVVLDYPKGTFTIAKPGALESRGDALPMPVSKRSGFPRTEIEVDGEKLGFLLDTGASFTMVSEVLLKRWGEKHPDWPRAKGAVGEAATLGGQTLETMTVPKANWGTNEIADLGVTSQREGTFETWMSGMMTSSITGSLAGNVLKRFRVDLDYPNEKLYLSKP